MSDILKIKRTCQRKTISIFIKEDLINTLHKLQKQELKKKNRVSISRIAEQLLEASAKKAMIN